MFRNAFHVEENVFCFFCLKIVDCLLTGPFYIWLAFTEVGFSEATFSQHGFEKITA